MKKQKFKSEGMVRELKKMYGKELEHFQNNAEYFSTLIELGIPIYSGKAKLVCLPQKVKK